MATGAEAITLFSKEAGILHATVQRTARALREAIPRRWPKSGQGGGKKARHVEPCHLGSLILALAGAQPSDAPVTVGGLGGALLTELKPEDRLPACSILYTLSVDSLAELDEQGFCFSLLEVIELLIRRVAEAKAAGAASAKLFEAARSRWKLRLNPDFQTAWILFDAENGRSYVELYEPYDPADFTLLQQSADEWPRALVQRYVEIPFELIEVAAELWADTLARRDLELSPAATGAAGGTAAPRTESAGGADTPPVPSRSRLGSRQSHAGNQPAHRWHNLLRRLKG